MKQVFFIGDTSNRRNWGCRATTAKLRELIETSAEIKHTLDTSRPHAELTKRLPYRPPSPELPEGTGKSLRTLVRNAFRETVSPLLVRYAPATLESRALLIEHADFEDYKKIARLIKKGEIFKKIARAIDSCDAVIINGEGSFMKNRTIGRFKLLLAYTARVEFGKPVAIANHSADFRHPKFMELARAVYPLIDDALFREKFSLESAGKLREGKPYAFAADAAFMYQPLDRQTFDVVGGRKDYYSVWPEDAQSFDPTKPYICVGGSSVYLGRNRDFAQLRKDFIDLCTQLQKIHPVVVTASSQPDDLLLRPVAAALGAPFLGAGTPVQQAVDVLGNAAAYVGGRWHPGIMALTGGTPVVTFSANSDYKSDGLVDMAGLVQPKFPAMDVGRHVAEIVELTSGYIEQGPELRATLLGKVNELRKTCANNIRLLGH